MVSKQSRILFVVNDSWFFKSHRLPLAVAAIKSGYEVHLIAKADETTDFILSRGVVFHPWALSPRSLNPIKELKGLYDLLVAIKRIRPHILHLVTIKSVLYGGLLARLVRVPSVVYAISGRGYLFSSSGKQQTILKILVHKLYRFVLSHRNSIVIVQNSTDLKYFVDNRLASEDKISLIPGSGVDLEYYTGAKPFVSGGLPYVLFASRMLWDKGVREYVEAAKLLNACGNRARFILAGSVDTDNPRSVPLEWLESLPDELEIRWIGHSEGMRDLLRESAFVVLPSTYGEGVPKILLEAAASGRAIITTNWPGCRDVVTHQLNGLIVEPKDVQGLADSMAILLDNPDLARTYGESGRNVAVNRFAIEQVIRTTLGIYKHLDHKI